MTISFEAIAGHYDAGNTPEQILALLQADHRHHRNCMATGADFKSGELDLLHILAARTGVLRLKSDATWAGPLVDYFNGEGVDAKLLAGFELLLTQLQISNRPVFCADDGPTGLLVTSIGQIVGALCDANPESLYDSSDVNAMIIELTGGPRYAGVTLEDVNTWITQLLASREAADLAAHKKELEDAAVNRLQSFREALSAWDGSGEEPVL